MASLAAPPHPAPPPALPAPRERVSSWPLIDRACYWLCWVTGIGLCVIAVAIVVYMFVKGISYLRPELLVKSPAASPSADPERRLSRPDHRDPDRDRDRHRGRRARSGSRSACGCRSTAARGGWPAWSSSSIEMLAGVPSIVLALFGLLIVSQGFLSFLSQGSPQGALGRVVPGRGTRSWRCSRCR